MGKIGLVNGLFHSRSLRQNVGGPIRLLCESDVIHGNNGNQESWAIEAVYRRSGYAGLKPSREKAVRSFVNGWDVLRASQPWMESLNASLSLQEVFLSRTVIPCWLEPPGKTIFAMKCLGMMLSCATVVPHFIWCHILHSYKRYVTIFAPAENENRIGRSPDHFFL